MQISVKTDSWAPATQQRCDAYGEVFEDGADSMVIDLEIDVDFTVTNWSDGEYDIDSTVIYERLPSGKLVEISESELDSTTNLDSAIHEAINDMWGNCEP